MGVSFNWFGEVIGTAGLACSKCKVRFSAALVLNAISLAVRTWTGKYYSSPLLVHGYYGRRERETRDIALSGSGSLARRKFDEPWLFKQLKYLRFLMDVQSRWAMVPGHQEMEITLSHADFRLYQDLLERVEKVLDTSAYKFINVHQFLAPMGIS